MVRAVLRRRSWLMIVNVVAPLCQKQLNSTMTEDGFNPTYKSGDALGML